MNTNYLHIILACFVLTFFSCNTITTKDLKEKLKQDSILRADSINNLFSDVALKRCYTKQVYKISKLIKTILADNEDTYILKGKIPAYYLL